MTETYPAFPALVSRKASGLLLTFSGIEGAGKSTLVRTLVGELEASGERPAVFWSRPGYTPGLSALKRFFKRLRPTPKAEKTGRNYPTRAKSFPNTWVRKLWLIASLVDLMWVYGVRIRLHLWQGRLVVCDRYLYDACVDMRLNFADDRVESWLLWRLLERLAPKPAHPFFVLVPLNVSLARCAERGGCIDGAAEIFEQRLVHYQAIAAARHISVLDGCKPLSENLNTVQSFIDARDGLEL